MEMRIKISVNGVTVYLLNKFSSIHILSVFVLSEVLLPSYRNAFRHIVHDVLLSLKFFFSIQVLLIPVISQVVIALF